MARLILPRPNKLIYPGAAPRVDPAHPASQNCYLSAVAVNSGTFTQTTGPADSAFYNAVTGAPLTRIVLGASPGAIFSMDGTIGPGYASSSSASSAFGINLSLTAAQSAAKTVAGIFRFSVNGGGGVYQSLVNFNSAAEGLWITNAFPDYYLAGDNNASFGLTLGHAYFVVASVFPSIASSNLIFNYVAKDLTTGQVQTSTLIRSVAPATVTSVYVGNDAAGEYSRFPIAAAMYSGASLSVPQLRNWADDPWSFWYPQKEVISLQTIAAAPTAPSAGWQQPFGIAPKVAQAFRSQATGPFVPPSAAPSNSITGMGWYRDLAKAWPAAKAFTTQAVGFSVPPPIAVVSGTLATTELTDIASFTVTYAAPPVFIALLQDASVPGYRTVYYKSFVNVYPPLGIAGILATTEAQDIAAFNATFAITGILAVTEGQDTASFTGSGVAPSGTLAVTEAPDAAAFTGNVVAIGTLAVTEAQDVGAFTGTSGLAASGTLAVTEAKDVAAFTGTAIGLPVGILATIELPDNVIILADYRPPPTTISPSPYPSRYDYGWYDRKKIRKR